ncbi:Uncharacterised protein [Klebsiella pneumoniae]|uniref:Uncharacterized protein n=1 Tax=Klebsiella pneumoniae TaxID=573 RepID=A0A378FZ62_KLEPN|nr:Uncharacterised protein [Klebsiella pneumoniae]
MAIIANCNSTKRFTSCQNFLKRRSPYMNIIIINW